MGRSERDLAEAKLRAFKSLDAPVAPSGKGFSLFWSRLDDDVRQAFRTRVLAVRPLALLCLNFLQRRSLLQFWGPSDGPGLWCRVHGRHRLRPSRSPRLPAVRGPRIVWHPHASSVHPSVCVWRVACTYQAFLDDDMRCTRCTRLVV
jgi:hypothetical protein